MKYLKGPHHHEKGLTISHQTNSRHFSTSPMRYAAEINSTPNYMGNYNNLQQISFKPTTGQWGDLLFSNTIPTSFFHQTYNNTGFPLTYTTPENMLAPDLNSPLTFQNSAEITEAISNKEIKHCHIEHQQIKKTPAIDGFKIYSIDSITIKNGNNPGETITLIPENFNTIRSLSSLLRLGKRLSKSTGYFFITHQHPDGGTYLQEGEHAHMYRELAQAPSLEEIRKNLPHMQIHPILQILLTTLASEYWPKSFPNEIMPDGETAAIHCDKWVDRFRMQARKANSTEAVSEWEEKPVKQYNEMISQFDLMLKNIKTPLNIIRIDLSTSEDSISTKCLNRLANALNNLQNNCINNKIPVSTKGLVWHLEYQERKGFHYQCVFFCDNKDDMSEEDIFTTLSEHWKYTILRGKGSVFNCSDEASLHRGKGIGLQDFSNQLVYKLFTDEILPMLTLVDKDLRLRTPQELLKSTHTSHMNFESNGYWFDISKK